MGVALDARDGAVDLHLVGQLASGIRREPPREPRLPLADAEGVVEVLHAYLHAITLLLPVVAGKQRVDNPGIGQPDARSTGGTMGRCAG